MRRASVWFVLAFLAACGSSSDGGEPADASTDATVDGAADASADASVMLDASLDGSPDAAVDAARQDASRGDASLTHPCALPGSVQYTMNGVVTVPGNPSPVNLDFLHLPIGFCAHYFATIGNARQLRFAPGGELFVASPTTLTTGGGGNGHAAIVVLADDDGNGVADTPITFLGTLPSTQGIAFTPGFLYYQDGTRIMKLPYASGDRAPSGPATLVANITYYTSNLHWPKSIDVADDGSVYVGNGGDQGELCDSLHPFHGGIRKIDGSLDGVPIAKGFRNPIAVRCSRGHNLCFALELAKDYSSGGNGREKLVPIRQGDDWGFPCCATKNLPYSDIPATDCSGVTADTNSFFIGNTPFGLAFEPGIWPAPWQGNAFVATHGSAGSWTGARVVGIPIDGTTGMPQPSTNINGPNQGMTDFATGWDDNTTSHGRPASLEFSSDGRMFLASDADGVIVWIAPMAL